MLAAFVGFLALATAVPQPLEEVDTEAYLGRWFQTYASFTVKFSFELGGNCVTADYAATSVPGVISVTNTVRLFKRWPVRVNGFAAQSQQTDGALSVAFFGNSDPAQATFNEPGNYWILKLGPMVEGKYDWAIVSDSTQNQLYVLTRDVARFREQYEEDVLQDVKDFGFTKPWNQPLETNQNGCRY